MNNNNLEFSGNNICDRKYKHPEAFCLMVYRCLKCKNDEVIWNSRDGVTPYSIKCPTCGGISKHIAEKMIRFVHYKPYIGQLVFVTPNDEQIKQAANENLDHIRKHQTEKYPLTPEMEADLYKSYCNEYKNGIPIVMKWGE